MDLADNSLLQKLDWDSTFFGLTIAKIARGRLEAREVPLLRRLLERERIDCLYHLVDCGDLSAVRAAHQAGFVLVDVRVTLRHGGVETAAGRAPASEVRRFRTEDLAALRQIARVSHADSRFYSDPGFSRERCAALYETWIEKSCAGFAQAVFVVEHEGVAAGYISCHVADGQGSIGLLAVANSAQGRGYGGSLVQAALSYFAAQGVSQPTVVTQGRNVPAQRLYQREGFVTQAIQLWYHLWRSTLGGPENTDFAESRDRRP